MSFGFSIGRPNQIETRRGKLVGHFQKNLPPRKLKMLPHNSSRYTGMIGAPVSRSISNTPGLNRCNWPDRLMPPSGKMQTSSPAFNASRDVSIARRVDFGEGLI